MNYSTTLAAILWRHYFSTTLLSALVVVLIVLVAFAMTRSSGSRRWLHVCAGVMRLVFVAAMALLLMGPSTMPPPDQGSRQRPRLSIMIDTSASMQTKDVAGKSRFHFAVEGWIDEQYLAQLADSYDVELLGFDERPYAASTKALARNVESSSAGNTSNIIRSVCDVLSASPGGPEHAAVVLISDGHDTRGDSARTAVLLAQGKSLPVHTVALGGPNFVLDLRVYARPMQDRLFVGEEGHINVTCAHNGAGGSTTTLHLRCGDELVSREIAFDDDAPVEVKLPISQPKPGLFDYHVSIDPLDNEPETANNVQTVFVPVIAQRINVLLLEGQPHWDTRFLARALRGDGRIALTCVTQLAADQRQTVVSKHQVDSVGLPGGLEDLARYDVIVLGRDVDRVLPSAVLRLLPEYVSRHGGRLVLARGNPCSDDVPLAGQLSPVVWGNGLLAQQSIVLTTAGTAHPALARLNADYEVDDLTSRLPQLEYVFDIAGQKPATVVLARTRQGHAAFVSMDYGRGSVLAILGQGLWNWRMLGAEHWQFRGAFDRLWSNLIRSLVLAGDFEPGRQVTLSLSQQNVQLGDSLDMTLAGRYTGADELHARATVIDPAGGRYEPTWRPAGDNALRLSSTFRPRIAGVHRIVVETPKLTPERLEVRFNVHDASTERLEASANPWLLRQLAEQSGGRVLQPDEPESLLAVLRHDIASASTARRPEYVWDHWLVLVALLLWVGCEWFLRRAGGIL